MGFFDSKTTNQQTTLNETENNAYQFDRRAVASEEAVAVTGDYNTTTKAYNTSSTSTTSLADSRAWTSTDARDMSTQFSDSSSRTSVDARNLSTSFSDSSSRVNTSTDSRNQSTFFADSSNRSSTDITTMVDSRDMSTLMTDSRNMSTFMSDSSDRSTKFNDSSVRTNTDYGSVGAALAGMGGMSTKAIGLGEFAVEGAIKAMMESSALNTRSVAGAFDLAKASGANALTTSAAVLGFATGAIDKSAEKSAGAMNSILGFTSNAIQKTNDAFATAKDKGDSKTVMYALAAVAAIAIAFALKD